MGSKKSVVWRPNKNEAKGLRALVDHLEAERESILTCVHRQRGADGKDVYRVRHPDGKIIMDIPFAVIGSDVPRQKILETVERIVTGDLEGELCSICTAKLLDGEEGVCSTCEAREVMGLLRLRDGLAE